MLCCPGGSYRPWQLGLRPLRSRIAASFEEKKGQNKEGARTALNRMRVECILSVPTLTPRGTATKTPAASNAASASAAATSRRVRRGCRRESDSGLPLFLRGGGVHEEQESSGEAV